MSDDPKVIPLHKPNLAFRDAIQFAQDCEPLGEHIMVIVLMKDGSMGVATSKAPLMVLATFKSMIDSIVSRLFA